MSEPIQSNPPKLFNRATIFFSTLFLSTFFGAILFSMNLATLNKKKEITGIILFAIIWNIICRYVFQTLEINNAILILLLSNLIGAVILTKFVWDYYFKEAISFTSRSILIPLVTIIVVYGLFFVLNKYY